MKRYTLDMNLTLEFEREDDGRWMAEVPELPGVMVYGDTREEAMASAQVLAFRVLADLIEHREASLTELTFRIPDAA
jgi:predicted RNase H-like HicB family nuclease